MDSTGDIPDRYTMIVAYYGTIIMYLSRISAMYLGARSSEKMNFIIDNRKYGGMFVWLILLMVTVCFLIFNKISQILT